MPKQQQEFAARRAEIVDDPDEQMMLAGDISACFCIINTKTGAIVGLTKSLDHARRILDKRDRDFGAAVHKIVPPIKPSPPAG